MFSMTTLKDLYVLTLCRLLHAEQHAIETLPQLIAAAADRDLTQMLMEESERSHRHADRLAGIFERLVLEPSRKSGNSEPLSSCLHACAEAAGLNAAPDVRDSAIIAAWRQYLRAIGTSYECVCNWSKLLGDLQAYGDLRETIDEKDAVAKALVKLATTINQGAMSAPA